MKLPITMSIVATIFGSTQAAFLRGIKNDSGIPFQELACSEEAYTNEDKCYSSTDHSGNKCLYCTGSKGGLCVTADIAKFMTKVPDVTCSATPSAGDEAKSTELSTDFSSLKCTLSAFTDEEKCAQVDNESCQYCQLDVAGQEAGLCLGADIASKLTQASDKVSCTTPSIDVEVDVDVDVDFDVDVSLPWEDIWKAMKAYSCTLKAGTDEDKCHTTKDLDGEDCDFCSIPNADGGVCATTDLGHKMEEQNPSITCSTTSLSADEVESVEQIATCLKAGMSGDLNTCRKTVDGKGEHCVFCRSHVADLGLCMPFGFMGKTTSHYNCDASHQDVIVSTE